jgi:hypothetical protein
MQCHSCDSDIDDCLDFQVRVGRLWEVPNGAGEGSRKWVDFEWPSAGQNGMSLPRMQMTF